jgi:hypothetical protein
MAWVNEPTPMLALVLGDSHIKFKKQKNQLILVCIKMF